jgi:hypothetical protein
LRQAAAAVADCARLAATPSMPEGVTLPIGEPAIGASAATAALRSRRFQRPCLHAHPG